MHDLMVGMFWGGLVMAVPPVLVGAGIVALLLQQRKAGREPERPAPGPRP